MTSFIKWLGLKMIDSNIFNFEYFQPYGVAYDGKIRRTWRQKYISSI